MKMNQQNMKDKRQKVRSQPEPGEHEIFGQAEEHLFEIRMARAEVVIIEENAEKQIRAVKGQFANALGIIQARLKAHEDGLMLLMKDNKTALFAERDKVSLTNGALLYQKGDKVTIPKTALAKIEAAGWGDEAIKTVKSVIREVVEKWSAERLAVIGARRRPTESYNYEVIDWLDAPKPKQTEAAT